MAPILGCKQNVPEVSPLVFGGQAYRPPHVSFTSQVTDLASFDTAFDKYLNPTTGQFAKTKQLNQLGCSGYRSGFVLQYEQSVSSHCLLGRIPARRARWGLKLTRPPARAQFLCGEFTAISYSASCNTNATTVAATKTCQTTCYQYADSELSLVNTTLLCNAAFNATREATLTRDFTSCTDWTSLATNDTATCVQGAANEANCGFRSSTNQMCNFCDTTGGSQVDACCVDATADEATCGFTVAAAQVGSSSASLASSASSVAASTASQPSSSSAAAATSHHRLSKGAIAGAVVGSVLGALLILTTLLLLLLCRRRRANRSDVGEGHHAGGPMMAENSTHAETYASDKAAMANETNPAFAGAAAVSSPTSRSAQVFPSKPQAPSPTYGAGTGFATGAAAGAVGGAALHDGYAASRTPSHASHQESLGSQNTAVNPNSGRILVSAFQDLYSEGTIVSGSHVVVLYSYKASLGDELSLAVGQSIQVISLYDDDWASGRLIGEEGRVLAQGAFPLVCVSLVGDTTTTTSPSSMSDEEIAATRGEESANAGYTDGEYATAGEEESEGYAGLDQDQLRNAVRR